MKAYVAKRLALGLLTLWGAVTVVFLLGRALPGDPVDLMLGENAPAARRDELRAALHLDDPLAVQYGRFLGNLCIGRMGESIRTREPVASELARAFPLTLRLGLSALLLALCLAVPLGSLAARFRGGALDNAARAFSTAGLALPSFFLGPLALLALAVAVPLFPVSGADEPWALVLPATTLAVPLSSVLSRVVRASLLEEWGKEYIVAARARGLSQSAAFFRHAFRNALLPVLTVLGLQFGAVLTGAILTEKIFRWPGLGTLVLTSISSRDYPVVQGVVVLFAAVYIGANLLTDLAYAWADPRVRLG